MNYNRDGEKNLNNVKDEMVILKYINARNCQIKFNDGTIVESTYNNFKNGCIKNPNKRIIYNVGYFGVGRFPSRRNGKDADEYKHWRSMFERVYNNNYTSKTYINCVVSKEWHNYQDFAEWYEKNNWLGNNSKSALDKDIISKNNKTYGKDFCIIVDKRINNLFTKSNTTRGLFPIGVHFCKRNKRFIAQLNMVNYKKSIGSFNTQEEAFYAYKQAKESYIKQVADEYKSKYPNFPQKLYDAMYSYEVEITD